MALNFQGDRAVGVLNDPKNTFNTDDLFRVYDGGILVAGGVSVDHGDFVSWDGTKWKLETDIKIANSKEVDDITKELAESAKSTSIAPDYDPESTYPTVGTAVMHEGVRYVSNTAIATAEEWNAAHWTEKSVEDEIGNVEALLAAL